MTGNFQRSFKNPYIENSVENFNQSWARNEQMWRQQNAMDASDARTEDRQGNLAALTHLLPTTGQALLDVDAKNQAAREAERQMEVLINSIPHYNKEGKSIVDHDYSELYESALEDEEFTQAMYDDNTDFMRWWQTKKVEPGEKVPSYEELSDWEKAEGAGGAQVAKSLIWLDVQNFDSIMSGMNDPEKIYQIKGGQPYKLNSMSTSEQWKHARAEALREFFSQPHIRKAPVTEMLPYMKSIVKNEMAWAHQMQRTVDFHKGERDNQAAWLSLERGDINLDQYLSRVSETRTEDGKRRGPGGAMDYLQQFFKTQVGVHKGAKTIQDWYELGDQVIPEGVKGHGLNKDGTSKTYADEYPRFTDPKYINEIEDIFVKAYNKDLDFKKVEFKQNLKDFAAPFQDKIAQDKELTLEDQLLISAYDHKLKRLYPELYKENNILTNLLEAPSYKTLEVSKIELELQKKLENGTITREDKKLVSNLPFKDREPMLNNINKAIEWKEGDTYTTLRQGIDGNFRQLIGLKPEAVHTYDQEDIRVKLYLEQFYDKEYFSLLNAKDDKGASIHTPATAANLASEVLKKHIEIESRPPNEATGDPGGILYFNRQTNEKGSYGDFDNFNRHQFGANYKEEKDLYYQKKYGRTLLGKPNLISQNSLKEFQISGEVNEEIYITARALRVTPSVLISEQLNIPLTEVPNMDQYVTASTMGEYIRNPNNTTLTRLGLEANASEFKKEWIPRELEWNEDLDPISLTFLSLDPGKYSAEESLQATELAKLPLEIVFNQCTPIEQRRCAQIGLKNGLFKLEDTIPSRLYT